MDHLFKKFFLSFSIFHQPLNPHTSIKQGRIHHCHRTIGLGQRALELTMERLNTRTISGGTPLVAGVTPLSELGSLRAELADSAIELQVARLLVRYAASEMDRVGAKDARFFSFFFFFFFIVCGVSVHWSFLSFFLSLFSIFLENQLQCAKLKSQRLY